MDSPKYFTLEVEFAPGVWSPDFGDFERAVVVAELDDRVAYPDWADNGDELKRKNYRIITE
jgi:hypothetical protein|tara:strand:- start:858 stop:1040 length:183 start_codon:yes stop_codon:yes gene_type:complete